MCHFGAAEVKLLCGPCAHNERLVQPQMATTEANTIPQVMCLQAYPWPSHRAHAPRPGQIYVPKGIPVTGCSYRADWEPEAASGKCMTGVPGVFWRCPAVLWGPSTPNPTQVSWKTLILKNWLIFPASCGYVVVLPHMAQVRFWRPKMPHSE